MSDQLFALKTAKKVFGSSAFTEHHINYCRVGFRRSGELITAIGDTWEDALEGLVLAVQLRTKAENQ
jgi:hypothetical protein